MAMAASTEAGGADDARGSATPVKHTHHGYFSQPSNTHASRLLASPNWREANTATSSSFLSGYFQKSRLHHLSTWKAQMQDIVGQALREEGKGREHGSPDLPPNTPRVLMHIDFDSFFVTVGLRKRPELRGKPVVVCHSTSNPTSTSTNPSAASYQSSTSEIASCSYEARAHGVRNGMSLGQARKYCPLVQAIPYAFQEYHDTSIQLYSLLLAHADAIEAVSVDEALIDVSLLLQNLEAGGETAESSLAPRFADQRKANPTYSPPTALAHALRNEILERTGCSASIGIGSNILLARLATRKAKPGGAWHLTDNEVVSFTAELEVDDLHGIGFHLRGDLDKRYGTVNVGELRTKLSEGKLSATLGPKQGAKVWKKLHGIDRDRLEPQKLRQSIGANVNYAIRFQSQEEAREFVHKLAVEVVARLKAAKLKGKQVAVNVMVRAQDAPAEAPKFLGHGICDVHHRSLPISAPGGGAVDTLELIESKAWTLIASLNADPRELRGIGISLHKLELAGDAAGPALSKPERGQQRLNFGPLKTGPPGAQGVMPAQPSVRGRDPVVPPGPAAQAQSKNDAPEPTVTSPRDAAGDATTATVRLTALEKGKAPIRGDVSDAVAPATDGFHLERIESAARDPDAAVFGAPEVIEPTPPSRVARDGVGSSSLTRGRLRKDGTSTGTSAAAASSLPEPAFVQVPTMSQIDPAMLRELPDWAREEVLQNAELGRKLQGKRPREAEASVLRSETKDPDAGRAGTDNGVEETPRKKRRVADVPAAGATIGERGSGHDRGVRSGGASIFDAMLRSARTPDKQRSTKPAGAATPQATPRRSGGGGGGTGRDAGRAASPAATTTAKASPAPDPETMSDEEVRALEIDPAFLRALPVPIQRELVTEHWTRLRSRVQRSGGGGGVGGGSSSSLGAGPAGGVGAGAAVVTGPGLFKAGQVHKYGTRAEERREAARKAARLAVPSVGGKGGGGGGGGGGLRDRGEEAPLTMLVVANRAANLPAPAPAPAPAPGPALPTSGGGGGGGGGTTTTTTSTTSSSSSSSRPSLTTRTGANVHEPAEIRALLSQWFAKRRAQSPRESEVRRIRDYILACVCPGARLGSVHWDVEGALGALGWWRWLLEDAWPLDASPVGRAGVDDAGGAAGSAGREWWGKWNEVREEVQKRISERRGRPVRM